nr:hypothetical protein [Tanacetum cinerariifolium]
MEESLSKFMEESAKRHKENSNLIKEIQASMNVAIRNQGASIKALEIQIGKMSKVTVPFLIHLYDDCYDEEEGLYGLKNFDAYSIGTTLLDDALPHKEKDPMSKLAPTKLIVELADRTMKRPNRIAENVLVGFDKKFFVEFIVLDRPEDIKTPLILGRSFLSTAHAKIDVFKRKITLRFRNDKVVFKESTIKEGKVIDELMMDIVKTRCDDEFLERLDEYPGYCDFDRKIHIDCAYNLQFSCMIDFVVIENMDAYHDEGIGDIFVGKPFVEKHVSKKGDLNNVQCNKMRPLVKVSARDELKGILHQYQKLKGFFKGFSNLGLEYIKNEKVEEWLTRGHVSIHEME